MTVAEEHNEIEWVHPRRIHMENTERLKKEIAFPVEGRFSPEIFRCRGYAAAKDDTVFCRRAKGLAELFAGPEPFLYKNDRIAGSIRPVFIKASEKEQQDAVKWAARFPERDFLHNGDHFAPDYHAAVRLGLPGLLARIGDVEQAHENDPTVLDYLNSMKITLLALRERLVKYAEKAAALNGEPGYNLENLRFVRDNCAAVAERAPRTFAEGLQLVWMIHSCFVSEGKYAMALGRIDQYLYPLFRRDLTDGKIDKATAAELLANAFAKIGEVKLCTGGDDVVNICIGGTDAEGNCAVNELSYCVLEAVNDVHLPGPNLSARIAPDTPEAFLDACLRVIGTGLGYPALMNDRVNMAALRRFGYDEADVRDYCMVGCIENFLPGRQPPWTDGRFDPIRYLEDVLSRTCAASPDAAPTMDAFMALYERRLAEGAAEYVGRMNALSRVEAPETRTSPFMSCFCDCCIERGRDINMGGAKYPAAHGAVLMGIGTVSDSLAAIEQVVFEEKYITLTGLADALRKNFKGYGSLRERLLAAPKYGNNRAAADKYAVWYVQYLSDLFNRLKNHDGGPVYTAMAANVSNIYAGAGLGATPDGRLAGEPLSDAASPTYGRDTRGVTATLLSLSKPDYTHCACGTVVNQKFSPAVFSDGKRKKLGQLIRVYFDRGGQEIQINSTSREVLQDAMDHPERYPSLVVRVSGFSALYVTLPREVQADILRRTQHEAV